ncbi:hypothetical protein [Lichenicola sp.]|uniref:hypothetical protein n=1 Tax=Lichenicola sp. TaxID=2804529 RepID=UPI003B001236
MTFGSFSVDDLGRVALAAGTVGGFLFQWRGRPISLSITAPEPDGRLDDGRSHCEVRITGRVGRVPSTANTPDRRPEAFQLAAALRTLLPEGWAVRLLADHMLELQAEERLPLPAHVGELLIPATRFTLALAPYLDLLEEWGMGMMA